MSITPEQAKAHTHAYAVTCCRVQAGTVIGPANLEEPIVLNNLEKAGFVEIPPECLTIGEVLGATLRETVEGFTPLTPDKLSGIQSQEREAVGQAHYKAPGTGKLVRKHVLIDEVKIGTETLIDGKTLYIREELCQEAIRSEAFVTHMTFDIITPEHYSAYSNTIMDVQPIAVKERGEIGEGVTRVIDGVVMLVTGTDERGVQIGEFGASAGPLERTMMWGRPGCPEKGEVLIKAHVIIKANMHTQRPGPLAAHKATDLLTQEIRTALKHVDETAVLSTEELLHVRRPGKKKVVIIKEIMGQGAMHDNLLMPVEPVGILGARANVDLGNLPIVVSPLQILDGYIQALW